MKTLKAIQTYSFDCDTCYGKGWLFWGDAENYDVEACDCNPEQLDVPQDKLGDLE